MVNSEDDRWARVVAREPGGFFLGVLTTGVFCRPGCPARTPRRENVRFYDDAQEALRAGFRPCLKCRPMGTDPTLDLAVRAARAIEADPARRWTGAELSEVAGRAPRTVLRAFEAALGVTPRAFRDAVRLRRYGDALRGGADATEAGLDAGYGGEAARHEGTRALGMSANSYAKGGAGESVEWLPLDTTLGTMVIAATAKGICLLRFLDEDASAAAVVAGAYPAASLRHAAPDASLRAWGQAVAAFVEKGGPRPDLPLDLRGTAFQLRVWQALRALGPGETVTYGELARRIEVPGAARAVGAANGANRVAVLIPCHLVVAAGGKLGGYAWGEARKRALIAAEKTTAASR